MLGYQHANLPGVFGRVSHVNLELEHMTSAREALKLSQEE